MCHLTQFKESETSHITLEILARRQEEDSLLERAKNVCSLIQKDKSIIIDNDGIHKNNEKERRMHKMK